MRWQVEDTVESECTVLSGRPEVVAVDGSRCTLVCGITTLHTSSYLAYFIGHRDVMRWQPLQQS